MKPPHHTLIHAHDMAISKRRKTILAVSLPVIVGLLILGDSTGSAATVVVSLLLLLLASDPPQLRATAPRTPSPTCSTASDSSISSVGAGGFAHEFEVLNQRRAENRKRAFEEWAQKIKLPQYLLAMDPIRFEQLVASMYAELGFAVSRTQPTRDGGIDVSMTRDGKRIAVQCKRVKSNVGEPVLRDLLGAMTAGSYDMGIVVTTGSVSSAARRWAKRSPLPIELVELAELQRLIARAFPDGSVVPDSFHVDVSQAPASLLACPECGDALRRVKGPYGHFLGCRGFPTCRYTRRIQNKRRR